MPTCKQCQTNFEITDRDREFYQKMGVPESTICHQCYFQTFLAFRNSRTFYKRQCDKCHKDIISIYAQDKLYPVYCEKCWWADEWSAKDYGQDFDFNRSFFEQWYGLSQKVPSLYMMSGDNENSDYTCNSLGVKNCYMSSVVYESCEDVYYSFWTMGCNNCCDVYCAYDSQLCYEGFRLSDCYNCNYCIQSKKLTDCDFCSFCNNCSNCLFCVNLRNKEYHIFNKPCSKEEYEKKSAEIFSSWQKTQEAIKTLHDFELKFPHLYAKIEKSEDCLGDEILNSKNCDSCFDALNSENCRHMSATGGNGFTKDCYEGYGGGGELSSHFTCGLNLYNCHYCKFTWDCQNSFYLDYCRDVSNCFGCVNLKKSEYCILNKQYTEEEYKKMLPKVITHMKKTGEWGKFFPPKYSPFGYNETEAMDFFSLNKPSVKQNGWQWRDENAGVRGKTTLLFSDVPKSINDVDNSLLKEVLECEICKHNYKIVPQELEFYRKKQLPIPHFCSNCRYNRRNKMVLPYELFNRFCQKCQKNVKSPYAPDRQEIVYCAECYQKEVY
ncbi:MAG: hypothetical protein A2233_03460 [Candidatus Kerfeldbacteria bacterium RIFOXYA2_FULL_38_24]|uniref:Uncharacterized protein n=1 Tax=Candidatus Kerfeldbacteria bacterium RIFOXYB2_FULL_38_14 TaxID=1798547 RepID=A0A1G2BEB9_9BACT|nr:MAG: hypothetical protein A2233_03460 [Candidatus Kerfeldbacteria bacterium RIFOXYA2_FULL_38_24]OGY87492.1 MAG: hypothetical protein A2319_03955 [Candidatus Kerfeldbacteria bacterium RIFOXYB2_FULL_38_14]OGY90228.1 MAG: hypothetical protein A2458_03645 [Candidatus Kerfeldbacteria bacterium RIFOXYC2_FULL_38_9]